MLNLFVGPYAKLEETLAARLRKRGATPGVPAPVAVLAPSWTLIRHLQMALTTRHGVPFANVKFHTFQSFARAVLLESGFPAAALVDHPLLEETLVEDALRAGEAGSRLAELAEMPGLLGALLGTVRDLEEAGADPDLLSGAALREAAEDTRELAEVLPVLRGLSARRKTRGVLGWSDAVRAAAERSGRDGWVGSFAAIYYYGAYDLTQRQMDFLFALAEAREVEVLFPAVAGGKGRLAPECRFAEPTLTLVGQKAVRREWLDGEATGIPAEVEVWPVPSPAEQWSRVARECARLIDERSVAPHDIAVVARTLEGRMERIGAAFRAEGIKFSSRADIPLVELDGGRSLIALVRALGGDLSPGVVLDAVSFAGMNLTRRRLPAGRAAALARRLWRGARVEDWEGLVRPSGPGRGPDDVAVELSGAARKLADLGAGFPQRDTWAGFARRLLEVLEGIVPPAEGETAAVLDGFLAALARLQSLGGVSGGETDRDRFWRTAVRAVERAGVRLFEGTAGVRIVDAMDARGLTVRALFLADMIEGVFPRWIREDPFLRDPARRILNEVLGYKIQVKGSEGIEEERMLFHLLLRAARERLYLVVPGGESAGRPAVPSGFLDALDSAVSAPGRDAPAGDLRSEVVRDISRPGVRERYRAAATNLRGLDGPAAAGPRDGLLGEPLPVAGGLRVTQLVELAQCPFRFYAHAVLGLDPPRGPLSPWQPEPSALGRVVHAALDRAMGDLAATWDEADAPAPRRTAEARLDASLRELLPELDRFPVFRSALVGDWAPLVGDLLEEDARWCRERGLRPRSAEKDAAGEIRSGAARVAVRGRIDRIDAGPGVTRIVDYKSHLRRDKIPGKWRFDPSFYQLALYRVVLGDLGGEWAFSVFHLGRSVGGVRAHHAEGEAAADLERRANALSAALLGQIESGNVAPFPDGEGSRPGVWRFDCGVCEFRLLCRRDHSPSVARLRLSGAWTRLDSALSGDGGDARGNDA